jgi:hypothetical protein
MLSCWAVVSSALTMSGQDGSSALPFHPSRSFALSSLSLRLFWWMTGYPEVTPRPDFQRRWPEVGFEDIVIDLLGEPVSGQLSNSQPYESTVREHKAFLGTNPLS